MRAAIALGVVTSALFATVAFAASDAERIEAALQRVEQSKITFIRNGDSYKAKAAAEHLRSKLKGAGQAVKTFDQFVDLLATKSSASGKPYLVKLEDGTVLPLAQWLRQTDAAAGAPK